MHEFPCLFNVFTRGAPRAPRRAGPRSGTRQGAPAAGKGSGRINLFILPEPFCFILQAFPSNLTILARHPCPCSMVRFCFILQAFSMRFADSGMAAMPLYHTRYTHAQSTLTYEGNQMKRGKSVMIYILLCSVHACTSCGTGAWLPCQNQQIALETLVK